MAALAPARAGGDTLASSRTQDSLLVAAHAASWKLAGGPPQPQTGAHGHHKSAGPLNAKHRSAALAQQRAVLSARGGNVPEVATSHAAERRSRDSYEHALVEVSGSLIDQVQTWQTQMRTRR